MDQLTHFRGRFIVAVCVCCIFTLAWNAQADPVIIDHNSTDITRIPQTAIEQARSDLHIAYGHTSHGSQLTSGMTGLVAFANGGGLGLSLPDNIFAWNNGGSGGALDLHDYAMSGDAGYYPAWVNNTRTYLNNPANSDVNVIIWSWCGQVSSKYAAGTLASEYLTPMALLETEYPDVKFVYMTGHVDIWADANNKAANQMIRDYCNVNDKILYDFADIERYNPEGTYFEYVNDTCDYYSGPGTGLLGNWATEWQGSHTQGVDWYSCSSSHTQPLNANRKAYAAWWLWAMLAGWDGGVGPVCNNDGICDPGENFANCPNDCQETDPPGRSAGSPNGRLPVDTTSTEISLVTDESATCRYSTTAHTSYDSMINTFVTANGTTHTDTISGLQNDTSYHFHVRCQDGLGNQNSDDFSINFFVGVGSGMGSIMNLYMQGVLSAAKR